MQFLKEADAKLLCCALPAWKHHKEMEAKFPCIPDAAKGHHHAPLHAIAELMYDQIDDPGMQKQFETLVQDILHMKASPTPPASPRGAPPNSAINADGDYGDDDEDENMGCPDLDDCWQSPEDINLDDSFEIPQFVPVAQVTDPQEIAYLQELSSEMETPVLPGKYRRISGKTNNNEALLGKGKGSSSGHAVRNEATSISPAVAKPAPLSDEDSDTRLTKNEKKKKKAKQAAKQAALRSASTSSPVQSRKSITKKKA